MSETNEEYGEQSLKECLDRAGFPSTPEKQIEAVHQSLASHVGAASRSDDITMLTLAYYGKQP